MVLHSPAIGWTSPDAIEDEELERRQKAEIAERLNVAEPVLPDVHPNVAELYRREVRQLMDALAQEQTRDEAAAALHSLIGEVVLFPGER